MPTIPAPSSEAKLPEHPITPPAPPTPLSSSHPQPKDSTVAAILFIVSLVLLCGLIGIFLAKSSAFTLAPPTLTTLPDYSNKSILYIDGTGPKNATIEISSDSTSIATTSDKNGKFSTAVTTGEDGKVTYFAIARKKYLFFFNVVSDRSSEISTIIDKTSPSIKLVSIPKILTASTFTLKGSASEPVKITVTINKTVQLVETDSKNNFSTKLKLAKGANTIKVVAQDRASNETSTATLNTTYAVGPVYIPSNGGKNGSQLPNSAGNLTTALSTMFGRMVAIFAVVLGILGYTASSSTIWLLKTYKKK